MRRCHNIIMDIEAQVVEHDPVIVRIQMLRQQLYRIESNMSCHFMAMVIMTTLNLLMFLYALVSQ